jgi:thiol-disulfide isomerase/thioredoxin
MKQICILIILFSQFSLNAQTKKYGALKLGEPVPEYTLTNLINYPVKNEKLSNFRGKLLILDFWSTGCKGCIESWPKLLKLQEEFGKQIQIVLVNPWEDEARVEQIFEKRKKIANVTMTLPTTCGQDSIIEKLFQVSGLPHVAWIDEKGVLLSITEGGYLNSKNIKTILNTGFTEMPQKIGNDEYIKPDFTKPFFINGNGGIVENVLWQSILTKYPSKLWPGISITASEAGGYRAYCSGCSIKELYAMAYTNRIDHTGSLAELLPNRIELNVSDTTKYVMNIDGERQYKNQYLYNLYASPTTIENLQKKIQSDLKFFFGLNAKWEKRIKKCLVLTAEDTLLISYKSGRSTFYTAIADRVELNDVTISHFIKDLEDHVSEYYWGEYQIIDETHFKGKLGGISFETNVGDYKALDKALQKYKMHFKLEEREVSVLVISEAN